MGDRIVRTGILTSDAVNRLDWAAEVFYRRLMSVVDDYGRFDGRLNVLRANLYPLQLEKVSDADVGKWRTQSCKAGLVSVYAVDGKEYVQIERFGQRLQGKAKWPNQLGQYEPGPAKKGASPGSTATHRDSQGITAYTDTDTGRSKAPIQGKSFQDQELGKPRLVVGGRDETR